MAYSISRPDLHKMRKESEREETMRKLRLENEIKLMEQQRELLTREICHIQEMQLSDKDCDIHDERELRKFRRERKREILFRQQRIEEEIMCLQRQLDQLMIDMRYRKSIEMLEADDNNEMWDYEDDEYEQLVIDECAESDSDASESKHLRTEKSQSHLKGILKDNSLKAEKDVSFKDYKRTGIGSKNTDRAEKKILPVRENQSTGDSRITNAKKADCDRSETVNREGYAFLTRQHSETRTNMDPLQSTTLEKNIFI